MYTIGQLANIIGIYRDKLRYYEEKGILSPAQNEENNYRQYDLKDIDAVLLIEFYRSLDLDFKTIEKLYRSSDVKTIAAILDRNKEAIVYEMKRLQSILDRIESAQIGCKEIESYLNVFTIKPMRPVKILGEISDFRAYEEFQAIHETRDEREDTSILKSLKRVITFDQDGFKSRMLITKDLPDGSSDKLDMLQYEKCAYTVVKDNILNSDVMRNTFMSSLEWMRRNGYQHKGIAIISMLLMTREEAMETSYLEVYIPVENCSAK